MNPVFGVLGPYTDLISHLIAILSDLGQKSSGIFPFANGGLFKLNATLPFVAIQFNVLLIFLTYGFFYPFHELSKSRKFQEKDALIDAYNRRIITYYSIQKSLEETNEICLNIERSRISNEMKIAEIYSFHISNCFTFLKFCLEEALKEYSKEVRKTLKKNHKIKYGNEFVTIFHAYPAVEQFFHRFDLTMQRYHMRCECLDVMDDYGITFEDHIQPSAQILTENEEFNEFLKVGAMLDYVVASHDLRFKPYYP